MFRLVLVLVLILPLEGAWLTDLKDARKRAFEEKKDVYVVFLAGGAFIGQLSFQGLSPGQD